MTKLYEVELNSKGMPNFSTAKEVPQRIKGKWERRETELTWWYECSKCGEPPLFDPYENEVRSPFCPWCGADMRQGDSGDAPNQPE